MSCGAAGELNEVQSEVIELQSELQGELQNEVQNELNEVQNELNGELESVGMSLTWYRFEMSRDSPEIYGLSVILERTSRRKVDGHFVEIGCRAFLLLLLWYFWKGRHDLPN